MGFSFFAADKIDIRVQFDQTEVVAGGDITGTVHVTMKKEVTIRALMLKYTINEVLYNLEEVMPASNQVNSSDTTNKSTSSDPLHFFEMSLSGDPNTGSTTVKPGTYTYPFIVPIPPSAPASNPGIIVMGSRQGCCCEECDAPTCNCKCCCDSCGKSHAVSVSHEIEVTVVVPNSLRDKNSKIERLPKVLNGVPANYVCMLPQDRLRAVQDAPSMNCYECGSCFCLASCCGCEMTKEQGSFEIIVPSPIITLEHAANMGVPRSNYLDVYLTGNINCEFDVHLCRFTRLISKQGVKSGMMDALRGAGRGYNATAASLPPTKEATEALRQKRMAMMSTPMAEYVDDRPFSVREKILQGWNRETTCIISSVSHHGCDIGPGGSENATPLGSLSIPEIVSKPGTNCLRVQLPIDYVLLDNICTYYGREITVEYAVVVRFNYGSLGGGYWCGGVNEMSEARLPIRVVNKFLGQNEVMGSPVDYQQSKNEGAGGKISQGPQTYMYQQPPQGHPQQQQQQQQMYFQPQQPPHHPMQPPPHSMYPPQANNMLAQKV